MVGKESVIYLGQISYLVYFYLFIFVDEAVRFQCNRMLVFIALLPSSFFFLDPDFSL